MLFLFYYIEHIINNISTPFSFLMRLITSITICAMELIHFPISICECQLVCGMISALVDRFRKVFSYISFYVHSRCILSRFPSLIMFLTNVCYLTLLTNYMFGFVWNEAISNGYAWKYNLIRVSQLN